MRCLLTLVMLLSYTKFVGNRANRCVDDGFERTSEVV